MNPPIARPGQPFALLREGAEGLRLAACDGFAAARGLQAGQRLHDARAVAPDLATARHDSEADAAALLALARWSERFSPWVAMDGTDGLLLDTSGVAHLFGGETALLADMRQRFSALGFSTHAAIAPSIGAAHALARHGGAIVEDAREALARLPVAALRITDGEAATLSRLGLKTIGSLYDIPRASLARRVPGALERLDGALGLDEEPLSPLKPPPAFSLRHVVADPIRDGALLENVAGGLIHGLCAKLSRAGRGASRVAVKFYRADGTRAVIPLGMARPSQDPLHMMGLLRGKLDTLDAGFGMDAVTVEAEETAPASMDEPGFMEEASPFLRDDVALAHFADRMGNRTQGQLARLITQESHIPERAEAIAPFTARASDGGTGNPRPASLLQSPERVDVMASVPDGPPLRFTWRRMAHRVVKAEGPERMEREWWREAEKAPARPRDYYIVEDAEGRRYWLYREGLYGAPEGEPEWFLHGLFA